MRKRCCDLREPSNNCRLPTAPSKIAGERACDRIRAGETVDLKPRIVRIDDIALLDYAWPDAKVRIDCGKGAIFVPSLATWAKTSVLEGI